jgi:hypothetical protein
MSIQYNTNTKAILTKSRLNPDKLEDLIIIKNQNSLVWKHLVYETKFLVHYSFEYIFACNSYYFPSGIAQYCSIEYRFLIFSKTAIPIQYWPSIIVLQYNKAGIVQP